MADKRSPSDVCLLLRAATNIRLKQPMIVDGSKDGSSKEMIRMKRYRDIRRKMED